jgi:hypothetical protein
LERKTRRLLVNSWIWRSNPSVKKTSADDEHAASRSASLQFRSKAQAHRKESESLIYFFQKTSCLEKPSACWRAEIRHVWRALLGNPRRALRNPDFPGQLLRSIEMNHLVVPLHDLCDRSGIRDQKIGYPW